MSELAGGSFRKFAAEMLASVAQMAIVQAVWEAAQGFAMLALSWFTGNPKYAASATAHFTAAAIYGTVGGVAAIAGRGLAGNAFKQQTSAATGGSGASSNSGGGGRSSTSGAYSGYGDETRVVEQGRNAPLTRETIV